MRLRGDSDDARRGGSPNSRSRSSSRLVSRNGARWLTAIVNSYPSSRSLISRRDDAGIVDEHVEPVIPAEDRFGQRAHRGEAGEVGEGGLDRRGVAALGGRRLATSSLARSVRAASRPAMTTRNPARARPSAVSSPIPALAPVTSASRAGSGHLSLFSAPWLRRPLSPPGLRENPSAPWRPEVPR